MKKKYQMNNISEDKIIAKYFKKLNFNKNGTFNFENDAAFIKYNKNKKIVVTTDSISENLDFFNKDNPKSIANKIVTVNLSDLSAMGANPFTYLLNLFLPKYIDQEWLKLFSNELYRLQKKYKFYLLGGDLSKAKQLSVSATFLGKPYKNMVMSQNNFCFNNDIWVTGNIGDSYVGLQILKNKINLNDNKISNYFVNKYYFPKPCILGPKISKYSESIKDISDGLIGDIKKMTKLKNGGTINTNLIPLSNNLKKIIKNKKIKYENVLNCGDDYELVIISKKKFRKKIINIAKLNKVKISRIGKTTNVTGLKFDSNYKLNIPTKFDHFS